MDENTERIRKRNGKFLWLLCVSCIILAVVFWFLVNKSNPKYEEVKAMVVSSEKIEIVNRKKGTKRFKYEVKVKYEGETYDLKNAHDVVSYPEGKTVTAYKARNKLYANIEGVKSSSPLATVYFVFLFSGFGLLIFTPCYNAKTRELKKKEQE